jgi:UDP-2-acetamido-3-amino-2,3-dideoxy-glucuronate N-acetyltransferase
MSYFRHDSAIVDDGASIGEGCRIWHFVHVCSGAAIGRDVTLGQNVFVAGGARIGDGCRIQNNVSVYDGVVLEDRVFCGPSAVFTNVVNPRAGIERKDEFRQTRVGTGASLGANCTILCGTTIGEYAFVGAGAVVTRDVKAHALVVGAPARQTGWMSRHGARLPLPLDGDGEAACPATGAIYRLREGEVQCLTP